MKHSAPFFLNINPAVASDPASPYAVLPVPYEKTVSYGKGTAKGPAAILDASYEIEDFDEEISLPVDINVQTLPALNLKNMSPEKALSLIEKKAGEVYGQSRFLLALGGEHTVTVPLVSAARKAFGDFTVLQFDAHLDIRDSFRGSRHSHACPMRRIREMDIPTVHVGIRSSCVEEYEYVKMNRIPVFWAQDIVSDNTGRWIKKVVSKLSKRVYISFDIDALDLAVAPGTGTPEPGGLGWYKALALLREVFRAREVVAADIVEVAPVKGSSITEFTAARLGLKMMVYHKNGSKG